jgi:uncharacterized membrane protein
VPANEPPRRLIGFSIFLVVAGAFGLVAALGLVLDKIALLENPDAQLSCNLSIVIGCSTNLNSPQGEVFGFPNPILGLLFWPAIMTVGIAILAGARFARWFWWLLAVGVTGSFAFVVWFVVQSIYVLGVLCPWCMVTWLVTIPIFWLVGLHVLRSGIVSAPHAVQRVAAAAYGWVPLITVACYLAIVVLAQVQLDVLNRL